MRGYMKVENGLPTDDDRSMYLEVKLSDPSELDQFEEEEGGMVNVTYYRFSHTFQGEAYDEYGNVSLGLPLKSVISWRYVDEYWVEDV